MCARKNRRARTGKVKGLDDDCLNNLPSLYYKCGLWYQVYDIIRDLCIEMMLKKEGNPVFKEGCLVMPWFLSTVLSRNGLFQSEHSCVHMVQGGSKLPFERIERIE